MTGLKYGVLEKQYEQHGKAFRWHEVEDGWKIAYVETTYQKGFYKLRAPLEENLLTDKEAEKAAFDKAVVELFQAHEVDVDEPWN